ncbi:UNVERIFIED_ORG: hypothetical protein J2W38_007105 [Variovorax paradoxus]|nr:hypothetical protein [Variovorax paradoxus]
MQCTLNGPCGVHQPAAARELRRLAHEAVKKWVHRRGDG